MLIFLGNIRIIYSINWLTTMTNLITRTQPSEVENTIHAPTDCVINIVRYLPIIVYLPFHLLHEFKFHSRKLIHHIIVLAPQLQPNLISMDGTDKFIKLTISSGPVSLNSLSLYSTISSQSSSSPPPYLLSYQYISRILMCLTRGKSTQRKPACQMDTSKSVKCTSHLHQYK